MSSTTEGNADLQAKIEYARRYRELHKEELNRKRRERYAINRHRILLQNSQGKIARTLQPYETLTSSDDVQPLTTESILRELDDLASNEYYYRFANFLKEKTQLSDEEIRQAYDLSVSAYGSSVSRRGYKFEEIIRKYLLQMFKGTQFYVYHQVPLDGCRIDFVVTEESKDKDKLDISKAFIVSTKTSMKTTWREDQHLYNKCKGYLMLSLDVKIPLESTPDNVYFCSPRVENTRNHLLTLKDLVTTIQSTLRPSPSKE